MSIQSSTHQSQLSNSRHLQDSSIHLSQIRVYSDRSLLILLEKLLFKVRRLIRGHHLDVNIPRLIIVIALAVSIFFMIKGRDEKDSDYKLISDVATVIGVGTGILFAITNFHNQYHYNKLIKSSQYIEKWNDKYHTELNQSFNEIIGVEFSVEYPTEFNNYLFNKSYNGLNELKKTPEGIEILKKTQSKILYRLETQKNKHEKEQVLALLDFFEYMGIDVKLQVADSDYLKDYFYSIVINTYEFLRKFIEYHQFSNCQRGIYCNFVYLAQTWEKESTMPVLPTICIRPLIITSADIEEVQEIKEKDNEIHKRTSLLEQQIEALNSKLRERGIDPDSL